MIKLFEINIVTDSMCITFHFIIEFIKEKDSKITEIQRLLFLEI